MYTFADDTAILSRSKCPQQASAQLAAPLDVVEKWLSDWRKKVNEQKCKQVTFTLNRRNCPNLTLNNRLKANSLHWLINSRSPLSLHYKVLLYNSVLKAIWTYGFQLWGSASNSNVAIVHRVQAKILRTITGAPWYVRSGNIQIDLNIVPVRDVIAQHMENYYTKLSTHPNNLARALTLVCRSSRLRRNERPIERQLLGHSNINTVKQTVRIM